MLPAISFSTLKLSTFFAESCWQKPSPTLPQRFVAWLHRVPLCVSAVIRRREVGVVETLFAGHAVWVERSLCCSLLATPGMQHNSGFIDCITWSQYIRLDLFEAATRPKRNSISSTPQDAIVVHCEVGYSRNLPAMMCLHNFARILTAHIHGSVTMRCKGVAAKSARKVFY